MSATRTTTRLLNGLPLYLAVAIAVFVGMSLGAAPAAAVCVDGAPNGIPEAGEAWAKANGEDPSALHQSAKLRESIQKHIDAMNAHFARVEQIKKFTILTRNFTIEDGELTPTLKVKRAKVSDHFADDIEAMYAEDGATAQPRV